MAYRIHPISSDGGLDVPGSFALRLHFRGLDRLDELIDRRQHTLCGHGMYLDPLEHYGQTETRQHREAGPVEKPLLCFQL